MRYISPVLPWCNMILSPGTTVKVTKGAFAGCVGVVLDPTNAKDGSGDALPVTRPHSGFVWVMFTLNGSPFPAHLYRDEIEPISPESTTQV